MSSLFLWIIILSFLIPMAMRWYRRSQLNRRNHDGVGGFPGTGGPGFGTGPTRNQPRDGYTQQDYMAGGFRELGQPKQTPPSQPYPPMGGPSLGDPYASGQNHGGQNHGEQPSGNQLPSYPGQPAQPDWGTQGQQDTQAGPGGGTEQAGPDLPTSPAGPQGFRARKLAELDEKYSAGELSMEDYMSQRSEIMKG